MFLLLNNITHLKLYFLVFSSNDNNRIAMGPKTWFKFQRNQFDKDSTLWQPLEVKIDMHDDPNLNIVYTLPDHTLFIKQFRQGLSKVFLTFKVFKASKICVSSAIN